MVTLPPDDVRELGPLVRSLEQVLTDLEEATNELRTYWQDRARRLGLNAGEDDDGRDHHSRARTPA